MRSTRCFSLIVFVVATSMVQQITVNGDSPRYLFGAATPLTELSTPGFVNRQMSLTPDGIEAFFVRQTFDAGTDLRTSSEIFAARRASTSDPFGTPQRVAELIPPATYGDNGPSISADGLTLYFGRSLNGASQPSEELVIPTQAIHAATRPSRNAAFGAPVEVTTLRAENDLGAFGRPEISADGLSLYIRYFHLDPPGWAFTTSDVVFNNLTSRAFPSTNLGYAGVNNAGATGADGGAEGEGPGALKSIGRFELIERVGVGGFGTVSKARDKISQISNFKSQIHLPVMSICRILN